MLLAVVGTILVGHIPIEHEEGMPSFSRAQSHVRVSGHGGRVYTTHLPHFILPLGLYIKYTFFFVTSLIWLCVIGCCYLGSGGRILDLRHGCRSDAWV